MSMTRVPKKIMPGNDVPVKADETWWRSVHHLNGADFLTAPSLAGGRYVLLLAPRPTLRVVVWSFAARARELVAGLRKG